MNPKAFEERTVFKVGTPARVAVVRLGPDFHMAPNSDFVWVHQAQPDRFSIGHPLSGIDCEHFLVTQWVPISLDNPAAALAGMPTFGPTPEAVPQSPFHCPEHPLRHDVAMVV